MYLTEPFFGCLRYSIFKPQLYCPKKSPFACCAARTQSRITQSTHQRSLLTVGSPILTECSKTHIKTELSKSCARIAQGLVTGSDMIIETDGTEICSGKCKQDAFLWNCHVRVHGKTEPPARPTHLRLLRVLMSGSLQTCDRAGTLTT